MWPKVLYGILLPSQKNAMFSLDCAVIGTTFANTTCASRWLSITLWWTFSICAGSWSLGPTKYSGILWFCNDASIEIVSTKQVAHRVIKKRKKFLERAVLARVSVCHFACVNVDVIL